MDMCSERKALLIEKWKNYRSFLTSQDTYKVNGSIKVLFILGGRNQLFSTRTKNLQSYIIENLWDILCPDSDFYIGSFETLYPLMIKKTFDPRSFFLMVLLSTVELLMKNYYPDTISITTSVS